MTKLEQTILKAYKSGMKLKDITKQINDSGFVTKEGKPFRTSHISFIANRNGLRRYKTNITRVVSRRPKAVEVKKSTLSDSIIEIATSNLNEDIKTRLIKLLARDI